MNDLPIYDVALNDEDYGLYAVSLVKEPAIQSNFIKLSKQEELFKLASEEKRELIGALLIPDMLIYRKMGDVEFMIRFSAETISKINERMQRTDGAKVFTINHELGAGDTVTLLESWIKETDEDKSSAFGIEAPIGTLFAKVKVNSDNVWELIKEGKLNGFSIELDASMTKTILNNQQTKKEKMDFKSMYSNSVKAGDTEVLLNGKLEKSALLFCVVKDGENEKLSPYSGKFKVDNVEYTAKDGLVVEVNDINLSLEQKIESVVAAVNEIKNLVEQKKDDETESISEKIDAVLTKMEEQKLALLQGAEKDADSDKKIDTGFSLSGYSAIRDWSKKWNK